MKNILILCIGLFLASCESWLDVSPKSDIKAEDLFSTQEGFEDALIGVYSLMTLPDLYGANLSFGYMDVLASYYKLESQSAFYEASKYNYKESVEEARLASIWRLMYKGIANLNGILEHVDKNKSVFSKNSYYIYKGEVIALRALLHFDLLRLFAPSVAFDENAKAIPYMDTYTHLASSRLSVRETLNRIIKDLNDARELMKPYDSFGPYYSEDELPDTPESVASAKSRMHHYAATALLARVYLYAGEIEKALSTAQEIIGVADGEIIPLLKMTTSAESGDPLFSNEMLFYLDKANLPDEAESYFSDAASAAVNNQGSRYLRMKLESKNKIYASANPADIEFRAMWFKMAGNEKDYVTLAKVESQKRICLLRVSELFLIAAECSKSDADKLQYINRYRIHRGLTELNELGDAIYEEYRKEFIGEGQMFFYYKRKNMAKIGITNKIVDPQTVYQIPLPILEQELGNN